MQKGVGIIEIECYPERHFKKVVFDGGFGEGG
jgi:hypothetical protein